MEDLKKLHRQKRGQISETEVTEYAGLSGDELEVLLMSADPKKRTIAAILTGNGKIVAMIPLLCKGLLTEKALYARIAISEALGKMGEPAVEPLIALLGKVGNNQETRLPEKYCEKKSYPLARDMAARTLVKIGKSAMPGLLKKLAAGDSFETQQAIDAIGGIASKTRDQHGLLLLRQALSVYRDNAVTTWKVTRALSAFRDIEAIEPLLQMVHHAEPAIRWEAVRSLGQIGIATPELIQELDHALQDGNREMRKAARIALERIKAVKKDEKA